MALQRFARWATALVAVASVVPAAARADHGTPFLDDRLGTYFGIAQAYWGGSLPTCTVNGVWTLPPHAVLYDDPEPSVAARAEQPGCRLWLDRRKWRRMSPVEACMVVTHEWGHLLGNGHAADPAGLMAEFPVRPPARCSALERQPRQARVSTRRARRAGRHHGRRMQVLRKFRT